MKVFAAAALGRPVHAANSAATRYLKILRREAAKESGEPASLAAEPKIISYFLSRARLYLHSRKRSTTADFSLARSLRRTFGRRRLIHGKRETLLPGCLPGMPRRGIPRNAKTRASTCERRLHCRGYVHAKIRAVSVRPISGRRRHASP